MSAKYVVSILARCILTICINLLLPIVGVYPATILPFLVSVCVFVCAYIGVVPFALSAVASLNVLCSFG